MIKQPPKQPTIPLMPRTNPPNDKGHLDENTPLILGDKVVGICKKLGNGYVECIIWDRCLTYEYLTEGFHDKQETSSVHIKTKL